MNLITGASGLLGSHVILELLKKNAPVRAMVRASHHQQELRDLAMHYGMDPSLIDRIEWVKGDVMDIPSLSECMQGCRSVYHCAAVVSYHSKDRNRMYQVNVEGTANVVNVALAHGNISLCFVSSIAAIGKAKNNDRLDENTAWVDSPLNTHYAITKNLAELEVWRAMHEGLQGVIVNPGFIIGPGNFDRSSASVFRKLDEGLSYYPPGGTGFIGVRDVAEIMVSLMEKEIFGERFILVAENLTMKELFQSIAAKLNKAIPEKEATPFILELARWGEALRELFTGRKALVTKESVRNASVRFFYDHDKITSVSPVTFTPIADAVADTARYFLSKKNIQTR
jgi:nucleoside-diphosphate-sugar epimerase